MPMPSWKDLILQHVVGLPLTAKAMAKQKDERARIAANLDRREESVIPIDSLPEETKARIEKVRGDCAPAIASYHEALAAIDIAKKSYRALHTYAQQPFGDAQEEARAEKASTDALDVWDTAIAASRPITRSVWHTVEQRLIIEFAPELATLCAKTNPAAYYEVAEQFGSANAMHAHLIRLLEHTEPPALPSYLDIAPPFEIPSQLGSNSDNDALHYSVSRGTSRKRLQAFENAMALQNAFKPTHLSLADTVNGLWTESIRERTTPAPDTIILPHMYSIMLGLLQSEPPKSKESPPTTNWEKRVNDQSANIQPPRPF
jgi:hypothetical protein